MKTAMNKDNLSTAFELISDEIEAVACEIAELGSKAFEEKCYTDAKDLAETGENLKFFKEKVDRLLSEWENGFDQVTRAKTKITKIPIALRETAERSRKTRLRVELEDGATIEGNIAADTLVAVIKKIGLRKVESLGIMVRGFPLVGSSRSSQYQQRPIDGKYIMTHSGTPEKAKVLEKIKKELSLRITISVM